MFNIYKLIFHCWPSAYIYGTHGADYSLLLESINKRETHREEIAQLQAELKHFRCSSLSSVSYTCRYGRQLYGEQRQVFTALAACYIYSCSVSMLSSHMYCIAAYAASATTKCPSDEERGALHDCCISADMDSREGRSG